MNVMVATDSVFIPYCKIMLSSLFLSENEGLQIDVYMPYSGLTEDEISELSSFVSLYPGKHLIPIEVDPEFKASVESHNGISIETYYRILAIDLLPDRVDKILYLDSDLVIKGSLLPLYETDLDGYFFAACEDIIGILNNFHEANKKRMSIPERYSYFNAGVLLMNIAELKKSGECKKILSRIYDNYERYEYNDQDVLNEMYYDKVVLIPWEKYNCPPAIYIHNIHSGELLSYQDIKQASDNPQAFGTDTENTTSKICEQATVIHYLGNTKPWARNRASSAIYDTFDKVFFEARKKASLEPDLHAALTEYLSKFYSLVYLEEMLDNVSLNDSGVLVLGSSYGLTDIDMNLLPRVTNLSMTSADIERHNTILKAVLEKTDSNVHTLILLLGEYALYDDMSRSSMGQEIIRNVYSRLLSDKSSDRWECIYSVSGMCNSDKQKIELAAKSLIREKGNFFSSIYTREDNCEEQYKGLVWNSITVEEKQKYAEIRASAHNRLFKPDSEIKKKNIEHLNSIINVLRLNGVSLYVVIPPFTPEYEKYINPVMKAELITILNDLDYPVELMDFKELVDNETFSDDDFFDMDHLSEKGAKKFSYIINEIIETGKV